jgi:hypothetical protein
MDADIQACIDAGIIMVACAGNDSVKITTDTNDIDYNNTVTATGSNSGNPIYFNQGSSETALPETRTNLSTGSNKLSVQRVETPICIISDLGSEDCGNPDSEYTSKS